jgi:predicted nuclease of predicted toxin-antitoxin system
LKLLLDENLSSRLTALIGDLYPGSRHVEDCELLNALDEEVWRFAAENEFAIVSKDSDFSDLSALHGSPPKVIWLRVGNCTTEHASLTLRDYFASIQAFLRSNKESCLVLSVAAKMPVRGVEE